MEGYAIPQAGTQNMTSHGCLHSKLLTIMLSICITAASVHLGTPNFSSHCCASLTESDWNLSLSVMYPSLGRRLDAASQILMPTFSLYSCSVSAHAPLVTTDNSFHGTDMLLCTFVSYSLLSLPVFISQA